MKFIHEILTLNDGSLLDNGWWELDGHYLVNKYGGRHTYDTKEKAEVIEAKSWLDFYEKNAEKIFLKKDSPYGWLSPSGEFFGCSHTGHQNLANYFFKSSEKELEEKGYIKISTEPMGCDLQAYFSKDFISENQKIWLEKNGFIEEENYFWFKRENIK